MAKRLKTITAGRLVYACCYTAALPRDEGRVRAERLKLSSRARQAMNLRYSWQKLELVLAANFGRRDLHVVLTYDDAHLPPDRAAARKLLKKFLSALREHRRRQEQPLRYIYNTEGLHGEDEYEGTGNRLHHHLVISGTGSDYEAIRSLWAYGQNVYIEALDISFGGYEATAKYFTKEPREYGKSEVGARTWTPSLGLAKPVPESAWVPDSLTLDAPPGAVILGRDETRNDYGAFAYIKYLLPEPQVQPPTRRRGRARIE